MKINKLMAVVGIGVTALTGCSTGTNEVASSQGVNNQTVNEQQSNAQTSNEEGAKETEEELSEEKEAMRIVSATVSATQVLDELEADLIGVPQTKYTLPARYDGLPTVGQAMSPDFESIVALDSDLVVIDSMFKENVEKSMEEFGLNAFYFNTSTYSNFVISIEELAKEIGKEDEAQVLIDSFRAVENEAKGQAKEEIPTVAILFGGGENFMLATDHSYLGDLVDTVGAKNITDDLNIESDYIPFSMEQIVASNPDYILRFAHGNLEETKKAFDQAFDKNPAFKTLKAVQEGKVIDLDPNVFGVSANIHIVDAIKTLGDVLYGE